MSNATKERTFKEKDGTFTTFSELKTTYPTHGLPDGYSSLNVGFVEELLNEKPGEFPEPERHVYYSNFRFSHTIKRLTKDDRGVNIFYDDPETNKEVSRNVNPNMYVYVFTNHQH